MDPAGILPPQFNLTGQVSIQSYMPDFAGNYSYVYRGIVRGNLVAVKIIKATGEPESMKRKVLRERAVWGSTGHPNIHPFYGYADDPAFGPFGALISPWSKRGDSSRFLRENGEHMILAERMALWKGIVEGVIYLHDQTAPIVHGDLKPGNVLIDNFGVPRICDFGLARIFLEQGSTGMTTTSEHTGTARYLAPELVASDDTVYPTLASDVYALGCLGLDFIYLQQPFSSHANNLRGQIFRDLRRGLPPAAQRPRQAWPSLRIWATLVKCWNLDPLSRPSSFGIAQLLNHTAFTFPIVVVKRIAQFVEREYGNVTDLNASWNDRCRCLRHLCLVSREYRVLVTPFLFQEIRLEPQKQPQHLSALMSALESKTTKALLFPHEPAGYGSCTTTLSLSIAMQGPYEPNISVGIRNLVERLPGLRLLMIFPGYISGRVTGELPSLRTLTLELEHTILFDHIPMLQALGSVQRLSILAIAPRSTFLQETLPFPKIYLPNLLEMSFLEQSFPLTDIHPFDIMSNWTMPSLRSLELMTLNCVLLRTYGPQLQHLKLTDPNLPRPEIFNLCGNLRSLEVDSNLSASAIFTSHPRLEKMRVMQWGLPHLASDFRMMPAAFDPLKTLKVKARVSFPKLMEAELIWTTGGLGCFTKGSFRTADEFITFRDGNKTYKLYDGKDTLVGPWQ